MSEHHGDAVADLVDRSRRLGSDPANTNYGGGNTSVKAAAVDPVTGDPVDLLWVKGSGGDLATLTPSGLAVLRLDRVRAMADVYPGVDREDEMVSAFDYCLHGRGGAPPSIDTAMHALVDAPHVDHLHPDAGIALATAVDGERLTEQIYGGRVRWLPWRRPGFQLGLEVAAVHRADPEVIGVILGGHGITAWGSTGQECEANSLEIIRRAQEHLDSHGVPEPFGSVRPGHEPLSPVDRRDRAAALAPVLRGLVSRDRRQVGHWTDAPQVLDFLSRERHAELAALGTSCPDHFLRTKVRPLVLDLPSAAPLDRMIARLRELHEDYRIDYAAYYARHATADSPPMRGADPAVVLVPGVGLFGFGPDKQTARVVAEFYVHAIHAMRGAEAVSTYRPIDEAEKFRIEYWELEEAKLRRRPAPRSLAGRVALVTGGVSGIGLATVGRLAEQGACVVVVDLDDERAQAVAADLGGPDVAVGVAADVRSEDQVRSAVEAAAVSFGGLDLVVNNAGLSLSGPLVETSVEDWDRQHDVMARGSFLVSRESARLMAAQAMGGDIVYVVSKNAVVAGPDNVAYGATKASQAHQVRLLAAELGGLGIRVNGVNPDAVVRGSGIFAGGWGAQRAAVHGVDPTELGAFYASRTLLKLEVLPEHVAEAVLVLVAGGLSRTTGAHLPVDGGISGAFLR